MRFEHRRIPAIKSPLDVVDLAASLEKVATDTYLVNLGLFEDSSSKALMASVMGVECQHLATLRAVKALLEGGAPELINIPSAPTWPSSPPPPAASPSPTPSSRSWTPN